MGLWFLDSECNWWTSLSTPGSSWCVLKTISDTNSGASSFPSVDSSGAGKFVRVKRTYAADAMSPKPATIPITIPAIAGLFSGLVVDLRSESSPSASVFSPLPLPDEEASLSESLSVTLEVIVVTRAFAPSTHEHWEMLNTPRS